MLGKLERLLSDFSFTTLSRLYPNPSGSRPPVAEAGSFRGAATAD